MELTRECPTRLIALPEGVRITSVVAGVGGRVIYVAADDRSVRVWTPIATPSWRRCLGCGHDTHSSPPVGRGRIRCAAVRQRQRKDPALAAGGRAVGALRRQGLSPRGGVRHDRQARAGRDPDGVRSSRLGGGPSMALHGPHWAAAACSAATAPCSRSAPRAPCGSARSTAAGRCASGTGGHQLELQPRRHPAPHDARRRHRPDLADGSGRRRLARVESRHGTRASVRVFTEDGTRAIVVHGELREYDASSADLISTSRGTGGTPEDSGFGGPPAAAGAGRLVFALRKRSPRSGRTSGTGVSCEAREPSWRWRSAGRERHRDGGPGWATPVGRRAW